MHGLHDRVAILEHKVLEGNRSMYSVDYVVGSNPLRVLRNTSEPLVVRAAVAFVCLLNGQKKIGMELFVAGPEVHVQIIEAIATSASLEHIRERDPPRAM